MRARELTYGCVIVAASALVLLHNTYFNATNFHEYDISIMEWLRRHYLPRNTSILRYTQYNTYYDVYLTVNARVLVVHTRLLLGETAE